MKKHSFTSFLLLMTVFLLPTIGQATTGNLRINANGSTSPEPIGGWFSGFGKRGTTYTMTASKLQTLLDSNSYDLTLPFDTIFISGNIFIDKSNASKNVFLTLRSNDYAEGAIVFESGATLTLKAASGKKSYVTLSSGNITGHPSVTADEVTVSNHTVGYERMEMPGFKTWKQWQIDTLLAHSNRIGDDIGDGACDFTKNTLFTVDSNHVFSMKAQTDFLNGKKIGFKNVDRGGDLLPGTYELGAYPDSFYVDLTQAEGIRFKVEVQGSAESFNIGLSNCLKENGWHVYCFEYYVYDIPFSAVDKDGYVSIPLSMFQKVSWSGTWDLSKLIVFIMEVKNITANSVVSFSDIHAYRREKQYYPLLTAGNMETPGKLTLSAYNGKIRQIPGTRINASQTSFIANGNIILPNNDNSFGSSVSIEGHYAYLHTKAPNTGTHSTTFNVSFLSSYNLSNVWVDDISKGAKYNYVLSTTDTSTHSYEICFSNDSVSLKTEHEKSYCQLENGCLIATGSADASQYHWFTNTQDKAFGDTLYLQNLNTGTERYFVEFDTLINGKWYGQTQSAKVTVNPVYTLFDTLKICASQLPYSWKDTSFALGTQSGNIDLYRKTIHGCDSIWHLELTVYPAYTVFDTLSICASQLPYSWKDTTFAVGTQSGNIDLYRKTVHGCDSIWHLELILLPSSLTEVWDTIKEGESYQKNGFDIKDTEVGTALFRDTLSNIHACDSVILLHLTTLSTTGVTPLDFSEAFTVYPNPTKDYFTVESKGNAQVDALQLTDASGRFLQQIPVQENRTKVSMQSYADGVYYLHVLYKNKKVGTTKVIKK